MSMNRILFRISVQLVSFGRVRHEGATRDCPLDETVACARSDLEPPCKSGQQPT